VRTRVPLPPTSLDSYTCTRQSTLRTLTARTTTLRPLTTHTTTLQPLTTRTTTLQPLTTRTRHASHAGHQVCAGLLNRHANATSGGPAVYTLMRPEDSTWLPLVEPEVPSPPPLTSIPDFLTACFASGVAAGYIRYK
jgi:hypothetical protein